MRRSRYRQGGGGSGLVSGAPRRGMEAGMSPSDCIFAQAKHCSIDGSSQGCVKQLEDAFRRGKLYT